MQVLLASKFLKTTATTMHNFTGNVVIPFMQGNVYEEVVSHELLIVIAWGRLVGPSYLFLFINVHILMVVTAAEWQQIGGNPVVRCGVLHCRNWCIPIPSDINFDLLNGLTFQTSRTLKRIRHFVSHCNTEPTSNPPRLLRSCIIKYSPIQ